MEGETTNDEGQTKGDMGGEVRAEGVMQGIMWGAIKSHVQKYPGDAAV